MKTKPGLEEEYSKYVELNSADEYSKMCVIAGEGVADLLDEGKTPEEAMEAVKGHGLTGFMVTMAVRAIAHFHPRGEELRVWWNTQYGAKKERQGLVNPAVLNVDEKTGEMSPDIENV